MSAGRALPGIGALIAAAVAAAVGAAAADEPIRFTSPEADALLLGDTEVCVETAPATSFERVDVYLAGTLIGSLPGEQRCFHWEAPAGASGGELVAVAFADDEAVARARRPTLEAPFGREVLVEAVQLYPVVRDGRGAYVSGLGRDEFAVVEDGRQVALDLFATEPATLAITLLLDTSSSMYDRLGLVQEAACRFIDRLAEDDRVAVSAFHHGLRHVTPLTVDHARAEEGIRALEVGGSTSLWDALVRVLAGVADTSGRSAVLVFSDGKDESSLSSLEDAVLEAHRAGAIVYAVGTGSDYTSVQARAGLRRLAEETGGEAFFIQSTEALPEVFDAVIEHLRSQYLLGYRPPEGPAGLREIEVRVRKPGLRVQCRERYYHRGDGGS
jgi:VWFA-related protein